MPRDNADELQTIATAKRAAQPTADKNPSNPIEGKSGTYTGTGNASATTFTVTHQCPFTPDRVLLSPKSAVAAAAAWVSAITATTFDITFAVAPASGASNIVMEWLAIAAG